MSNGFDPGVIKKAMVSPRWAAITRLGTTVDAIGQWDAQLIRQTRILVPIDVQALYVPAGDTTSFVRLPLAVTSPDGQPPADMPAPMAPGTPRQPGVHLHWAPPDALLRGEVRRVEEGSRNRLGLPPLPDRWVVLRILAPNGASVPNVTGWVIEADTAKAVPIAQWPSASAATPSAGMTLTREQLTGSAGGSVNWAGVYDAVTNRLAFHDPLTDLAAVAPQGAVGNLAAYVVAGWWSDPKLDPLDGAETSASLHDRLASLAWRLVEDVEGGDQVGRRRTVEALRRESLGLPTGARYSMGKAGLTQRTARLAGDRLQEFADPITEFRPVASAFVNDASVVVATEPRWPRSTLLHGAIHGVPVAGPVTIDQRPSNGIDIVLGRHLDDVAAGLAAANLGTTATTDRRGMERMLSAFTGQLLSQLGSPEGVVATEEYEHEAGFASLPGGPGAIERLTMGGQAGPLTAGRGARSELARVKAEGAGARTQGGPSTKISWAGRSRTDLYKSTIAEQRQVLGEMVAPQPATEPKAEVREVRRPAPRFHVPMEPVVAIRGARRSLRHQGDGRFSPDGKLQCRWPSQVGTSVQGLVNGADLIASLPSGGVPDEVLLLARSAIVQDPYLVSWVAQVEASRHGFDEGAVRQRLTAEAAIRFGSNGVYDGTTSVLATSKSSVPTRARIADELRRFSLVAGVDTDPVGVTVWSQPWVPLWLEWEVAIDGRDRFEDWKLGQIDLEPPESALVGSTRTLMGRSPLTTGTARTLAASIAEWLKAEEERDQDNVGEIDGPTAEALDRIADAIEQLDIVAATLDGIREQLLGLSVDPFGVLRRRDETGIVKPVPVDVPQLILAGALGFRRARLVDAFGRTLDLPLDQVRVPARDEIQGSQGQLRLRPRISRPARWLFRLVDPADTSVTSREATIDQIDATQMVNPVSGFLLPDHIDEALEIFDTAGQPVGQLMHEPFGGGVVWEIAPGRSGPVDAGPLHELGPAQQLVGLIAAGMVGADASARRGRPGDPDQESALSALLRAVDTTLWTVDTFAQLGSEHIAGLVGRPIAVVRATLRVDIDDDFDELDLSDEAIRVAREAAYRALADRVFPVRLGELTRSDDGLLAFFVDDDYSRVHVVDKVVRDGALEGGRGRGQLAQLGTTSQIPEVRPITHPYVVAEDELLVHPGQVVRLTLLMHPAGKVHLTSGILPRKSLQLARDWVQPGLAVIAPSVRVGPVLVDQDAIRLPKVSAFPKDQIWTRRDTPSTWKSDPILAATQTALLPEIPSEVQEGYIRVAPVAPGTKEPP